jgi:hypothetical protein
LMSVAKGAPGAREVSGPEIAAEAGRDTLEDLQTCVGGAGFDAGQVSGVDARGRSQPSKRDVLVLPGAPDITADGAALVATPSIGDELDLGSSRHDGH